MKIRARICLALSLLFLVSATDRAAAQSTAPQPVVVVGAQPEPWGLFGIRRRQQQRAIWRAYWRAHPPKAYAIPVKPVCPRGFPQFSEF